MTQKNTKVLLCRGVPNDSEHEHTLWFATEAERRAYYTGKTSKTLEHLSYQRTGATTIKVNFPKEEIDDVNYMVIQNLSHEDKWYYCFVKNVTYLNDVTSEIEFFVDDVQTWLPSVTIGESFVVRNHSYNDIIGENVTPESVSVGSNYEVAYDDFISERPNNALIIYTPGQVSADDFSVLRSVGLLTTGANYQGYVNLTHFTETGDWAEDNDILSFMNFLNDYSGTKAVQVAGSGAFEQKDVTDNIISITQVPNHVLANGFRDSSGVKAGKKIDPAKLLYFTIPRTFGGYTPKNRKMYTYPYVCLRVSNSSGTQEEYHFEHFDNDEASVTREKVCFEVYGSPMNVPSVSVVPRDHLGNNLDYDRAVMITGFPLISYGGSRYRDYINSQGQMEAFNNVTSAISKLSAGFMTGTPQGLVSSAVSVGSDLLRRSNELGNMMFIPNDIRNFENNTNVNTMLDNVGFHFKGCTLLEENARQVDDYFTRYGYAQNRLMTPSIHARSRFTFVQTNGLVLNGDLSQDVAMNLQRIFNKGITFWAVDDVGNYEPDNVPLGSRSVLPSAFVPNIKDSPWMTRTWSPDYKKPVVTPSTPAYTPRLTEDGIETASNRYYNAPLNVAGTFQPGGWLLPNQSLGCSVYAYGRSLEIADRYGALGLIRTTLNESGAYDWKSDPRGQGAYLSPNTPSGYSQNYPTGENCVNSAVLGGWRPSYEPQLGALISWSYTGGEADGHVAVVEAITYGANGLAESITVSESNSNFNPPTGFDTRVVYRTTAGRSDLWYDPTGTHPKKWTGAFALNPAIGYIGPVIS